MSTLDFPSSPTVDQEYQSWKWDGAKWVLIPPCPETLWKKAADTELTIPPVPTVTVSTDVNENP